MNTQFSLGRMFQVVVVVAIISTLFAQLKWPLALLALAGLNAVASIGLWYARKVRSAQMAIATSAFLLATLFFTDWALSSPRGIVRVAWRLLGAACIMQVVTIVAWLFSAAPTTRNRLAEEKRIANNTGLSSEIVTQQGEPTEHGKPSSS